MSYVQRKIAVYDANPGPKGGAFVSAAILARALSTLGNTTLIHSGGHVSIEYASAFTGINFKQCKINLEAHSPGADEEIDTSQFDFFATLTHHKPPICAAREGLLLVLFPLALPTADLLNAVSTYNFVGSNSEFTALHVRERWGIQSNVLYPAIETQATTSKKQKKIVTVGRIGRRRRSKCHLQLAFAAKEFFSDHPDWCLVIAGSADDAPETRSHIESLKAVDRRIIVRPNLNREELEQEYAGAELYWHATGVGAEAEPALQEHFGMTVVEAMSHGCVACVPGLGGLREIVQHGSSGFHYSDMQQLLEISRNVVRRPRWMWSISDAARKRSKHFDHEQFLGRLANMQLKILAQR